MLDRLLGVLSLVGGVACLFLGLAPRGPGAPAPLLKWRAPPTLTLPPPPPPPEFVDDIDVTDFQKGNIHAHSRWSDGDSHPEVVYEWYRSHGYQWIALT